MLRAPKYRAEINAVRQLPLGCAWGSPAAIAILANQSISEALNYIAGIYGRNNDSTWPSCGEVRTNASWQLMFLVQQARRCKVIEDVVRLAKGKLIKEIEAAVDNNRLSFHDAGTEAAESFEATNRRRVKAAGNNPNELHRFGCEVDESVRHKKAARNLRYPRSLEHAAVVRENGRVVPYKWRRPWWLDDETSAENPSSE